GGATGQNYTATSSGLYKSVVTDTYGCSMTSNEINFALTPVTDIGGAEIGLIVSPNPAHGQFTVQLETKTKADLDLSLVNELGQEVYKLTIPGFIGRLSREIKPGNLASGVYYLKIKHNKKAYTTKLIMVP